ncbi:probable methyltransferase PMT3 [Selaginella moellendorffii]|uniref:probable methyltransferase PMT3 n=1 Tax=Selaginella moellendorffii TaxID=88036 RepID=UPI000D1D01FB|nr:probable methyltransferase PMT3 [Selaginella moellendorffii]|eukprot:XP_002978326.2 probable methyltransferase PMT3 [Selaginella moellendorffii]
MRSRSDPAHCTRTLLSLTFLAVLVCSVYYTLFLRSRLHSVQQGQGHGDLPRSSSKVAITTGISTAAVDEEEDGVASHSEEVEEDGIHSHKLADEEQSDDVVETTAVQSFLVCDEKFTEIIPCLDRTMLAYLKNKPNYTLMEHYERHCPPADRRINCLVPPPANYKVPIKWPASRDQVWRANVPHTFLASEKSDQHWMVIKGNKVIFPGGGTHFHDGADKYIAGLGKMLKNPDGDLSSKGKIRTVLDVGCGVASFGAYLLPLDILAMSMAPNDVHENQIQFALERGIPSTLGVLGTMRLPFPSKAYDLAHCSRCRIDWAQRDGILLLEVDRVLRPGGYFAWSSPAAYRDDDEDRKEWDEMTSLTSRMCWSIAAKEGQTVIWMKPLTNECYKERPRNTRPPLCSPQDDPDAAWQVKMKACLVPLTEQNDAMRGSGLLPWPERLVAPPPRLEELHISDRDFEADTAAWKDKVEVYWEKLELVKDFSVRNVMDMKAHLGGFAAALKDKPVWVMNVVPASGPSTLKVVYDRGLIGSYHDWCESFSTYPRTYDLLHAWDVLSDVDSHGCSVEDLLLEMDRLLRPMGYVIIRDSPVMVDQVKKYLGPLHWDAWVQEFPAESDMMQDNEEAVLLVRKRLWKPGSAFGQAR